MEDNNFIKFNGIQSEETLNQIKELVKENKELKQRIERIKEYSKWHVDCDTDDIEDLLDDSPTENANAIMELKEYREHWRDVYKMCDGNYQIYMTNFIFAKE